MEILLSAALFSLPRHFQQDTGLVFGAPGIENGAAGDQQIGTRLDHRGNGLVGHAPIDLDSEVEIKFSPEFYQMSDLVQREMNEFLTSKTGINAHY